MSQRFVKKKTSNRLTAAKIPAVPAPSTAILVFRQFVREWRGDATAAAMIEASESRRGMSQKTIMISDSIICQKFSSSGYDIVFDRKGSQEWRSLLQMREFQFLFPSAPSSILSQIIIKVLTLISLSHIIIKDSILSVDP